MSRAAAARFFERCHACGALDIDCECSGGPTTSTRVAAARVALEQHRAQVAAAPPTLDDALRQRDDRIHSSAESWRGDWAAETLELVASVADRLPTFTADDVRDAMPDRLAVGADLRALGSVLRNAVARGLIEPTATYAPSRHRHASPLRVWRSRSSRWRHHDAP